MIVWMVQVVLFVVTTSLLPTVHSNCTNKVINLTGDLIYMLASPGHPNAYASGLDCKWHLHIDDSKYFISFQLWITDLPYSPFCDVDYLLVYEGPSIDDTMLKERVCGSTLVDYRSRGQDMTIVFHSSPGSNANLVGFKANVFATKAYNSALRNTVAWSVIAFVALLFSLVIVRSVIPSQTA